RNTQIGDYNIHRVLIQNVEGLLRSGCGARIQAGIADHIAAKIADRILVVNNENGCDTGSLHRYGSFCSGGHSSLPSIRSTAEPMQNRYHLGTSPARTKSVT